MSGEAGGLLLIPLLIPAAGVVLVGGAVVMGVAAAAGAASDYEKRRRERREMIRRSGVQESIGSFRQEMANNMNEQTRLNVQASEKMMQEMNIRRQQMVDMLQSDDPDKYNNYVNLIKENSTVTTQAMIQIQEGFVKNYHVKINESMENVTKAINDQHAKYFAELQQLQNDQAAKKQKAREIADQYIEEAKVLLESLEKDYEGAKFSFRQMTELQKTLNDAIVQYNNENYESAIAAAKGVSVDTIEEIYNADCLKQEWENYYKIALSLTSEIDAYLAAQEYITEDIKVKAEQQLGRPLEDDIVGVRIADYTGCTSSGENQFDYLVAKNREIKQFLESDEAKKLSTQQMKDYIDILNNKIYASSSLVIYKSILNMNNAFSRQNISEELIDFFEEHNFNFTGYSYENGKHDGALFVGFDNDVTGEEIVITLSPEVLENGDVQTRVKIDQLNGDETNEERKQYYRDSVQNVVCQSTPGAQIKLECKRETRNRLSQNTDLKNKVKS